MTPTSLYIIPELGRSISPVRDFVALMKLWSVFTARRFDAVHLHTPKASFLGAIAARAAGGTLVIHHLHGLLKFDEMGRDCWIARAVHSVTCALAHLVIPVSRSLGRYAADHALVAPGKLRCMPYDSFLGIDVTGRFVPRSVRASRPGDFVIGIIGRICMDKGWDVIPDTLARVQELVPHVRFLVVGTCENADAERALKAVCRLRNVTHIDYSVEIELVYEQIDLLLFPSQREGFGQVALEANAMGVPVVASRIPGIVDAVADGVTGTLVWPREPEQFVYAVLEYARDPALAKSRGLQGRRRAVEKFDSVQCVAEFGQLCQALYDGWKRPIV